MRFKSFKSLVPVIGMAAALLYGAGVYAQDKGICKSTCEADKQECRSTLVDTDGVRNAIAIGLLFGYPQHWGIPSGANVRDDMAANSRANDVQKSAQQERSNQCTTRYMQCTGGCLSDQPQALP